MEPQHEPQADRLSTLGKDYYRWLSKNPYPTWRPSPPPPRHISATGRGILVGMLAAFGSVMVVLLFVGLFWFLRYTSRGRIFLDRIGRPGEFDDEQAFAREEAEALEEMDDLQRAEYMRAKAYVQGNPPESAQTDISLSQFLAIQEKGVSAWEFEPELEIANCFVEARTEIEFFDSECSVQTNLPVPKQNEVYYWEAKIYDKPDSTTLGIGMTTKPYPLFRMPGYHKTSVAYLSPGHRRFNQPFNPIPNYGPPFVRGDVVGVGYRPRTGTVFFTRNGKKLEDVTHTLKSQNLFPTVGATGPATVHVNFGQMGFVYIEANVKKWGLAPMTGSLAPPPPYGSEQGSILLEGADRGVPGEFSQSAFSPPGGGSWNTGHGRSRSAQVRSTRGQHLTSPGPHRSPTDISLAQLSFADSQEGQGEEEIEVSAAAASVESTSTVSISHQRGSDHSPPPEYTSPLPQQQQWPPRDQSRQQSDYFNTSHQHSSSRSSIQKRPKRRSHQKSGSDPSQRSKPSQQPRYYDSPDEDQDQDPEPLQRYTDAEEDITPSKRQASESSESGEEPYDDDARSSTTPLGTATRHSYDSSRVLESPDSRGNSDEPSPPIPSYDAAVAESERQD